MTRKDYIISEVQKKTNSTIIQKETRYLEVYVDDIHIVNLGDVDCVENSPDRFIEMIIEDMVNDINMELE